MMRWLGSSSNRSGKSQEYATKKRVSEWGRCCISLTRPGEGSLYVAPGQIATSTLRVTAMSRGCGVRMMRNLLNRSQVCDGGCIDDEGEEMQRPMVKENSGIENGRSKAKGDNKPTKSMLNEYVHSKNSSQQ